MTIKNDTLQLTANNEKSKMSIRQFKCMATLHKIPQIELFQIVMDTMQKQEKNLQPTIQKDFSGQVSDGTDE